MISKLTIAVLLLAFFVSFSESAVAQQLVKLGERVTIDIAQGKSALSRTVNGQKAVVQFKGAKAGVFVLNGKNVDSSNYEVKPNGVLIIKKVTKADIGEYAPEPNDPVPRGNGGFVAGPVLVLSLA
ncbi:unnamed protein product [Caenorhabditis angaria]|uniref:Uncharacterized protein n=1 Tax=Caenorhabditis angaria TaxID=860376 RepID=A0A9P1IAH5_9PELO|nr:unnamed protein product [Caenorhabditis angaria]CAI5441500.1 unnamed protein product [Caenorhabditis angaria]